MSSSTSHTGRLFARTAELPWEVTAPGVKRQILVHGPDLMLVRVDFERDAVGALHQHPHRQATYVAAGRFECLVGDETRILVAGDSFFARADVPHAVRALEPGTLIDSFTPAREDFLAVRG
jgi:quercetin dioxygenase-like cupin family protein